VVTTHDDDPPRALARRAVEAQARAPHYCAAVPWSWDWEHGNGNDSGHPTGHRSPQQCERGWPASTPTTRVSAAHDDHPRADAPRFPEWAREGRVRCAEVDRLLLRRATYPWFHFGT